MRSLEQRVFAKVDASGICWEWTGSKSSGYGNLKVAGKTVKAHRTVYELLVGPIPQGLELDHLCRVRACVNPDHLEPVTRTVNIRRGSQGPIARADHLSRTHCPQGHEYDEANTKYEGRNGCRHCRACDRDRHRAARAA